MVNVRGSEMVEICRWSKILWSEKENRLNSSEDPYPMSPQVLFVRLVHHNFLVPLPWFGLG